MWNISSYNFVVFRNKFWKLGKILFLCIIFYVWLNFGWKKGVYYKEDFTVCINCFGIGIM